jgi:hypothetical protein
MVNSQWSIANSIGNGQFAIGNSELLTSHFSLLTFHFSLSSGWVLQPLDKSPATRATQSTAGSRR